MNKIELRFSATLENEVVVRNTIGLFASTLNCTVEDIIDVKKLYHSMKKDNNNLEDQIILGEN